MAHYDIFREELALKYHALGHALWEPSPGQLHGHTPRESSPGELRDSVSIGDVGFIRGGQFHRIFNALLPRDHPVNMTFGTPTDHEPLRLTTESHISANQLDPNNFYSTEVTMVSGGLNVSLLREGGSADVSFKCSKEQGAILSLPVQTQRQDTLLRGRFRKWIIDHIDSWFAFSRSLELGIERMEDIILVTGCHLTRSFVNIAFSKSQNDVQVTFGVCAGDSKAEIAWRFSREPIHGAMVKYGPDGDNLPENQCIFVRGFRASRPLRILPVKIEGTAEPTADSDPLPDKHLISVPSSRSFRDPLHVLLQYLAEKEPSCDMALVHDDDLGCISEASLRSLQPDAFMGHLRDSQPQTYYHQSFDHEGSSKADARVRVAMFEREYKSSPPGDTALSSSGASCTPSPGPRSSLAHSMHGVGSQLPDISLLPPAAVTPVASSSSAQPSEEALSSTVMEPERPKTYQWVGSQSPLSLGISRIPGNPNASGFLTDGYISYTFSPRVAEIYIAYVFKVEPTCLQTFRHEGWPGVFFVSNSPVDDSRHPLMVNGRPAWVLDYAIRSGGPVVPQQLWIPHSQGDFRRYVGQASLHLPVFFLNRDGRLGVPVTNAVAGEMSLRAADEPLPLGNRTTVKIRICWPGYRPSEQQIQLKDQTPARNPISFERFVRHLGSRVRQFLVDCEGVPISQLDPNSKWILGRGRISVNEVVLIGIVHVSAGSWMPILQLGSSRDTRPDGNSSLPLSTPGMSG